MSGGVDAFTTRGCRVSLYDRQVDTVVISWWVVKRGIYERLLMISGWDRDCLLPALRYCRRHFSDHQPTRTVPWVRQGAECKPTKNSNTGCFVSCGSRERSCHLSPPSSAGRRLAAGTRRPPRCGTRPAGRPPRRNGAASGRQPGRQPETFRKDAPLVRQGTRRLGENCTSAAALVAVLRQEQHNSSERATNRTNRWRRPLAKPAERNATEIKNERERKRGGGGPRMTRKASTETNIRPRLETAPRRPPDIS